jgi:hypothetical protein
MYEVRVLVLFVEFALIQVVVQRNGAPVWLIRAAQSQKNVLQWLVDKGIKPPALDSFVWQCGDLGRFRDEHDVIL